MGLNIPYQRPKLLELRRVWPFLRACQPPPDDEPIDGARMGEVFLIRHGQASFGAKNYDNLSPLGHQQSEWLGHYLAQSTGRFDRVVSGTLRRHKQTLDGIRKTLADPAPEQDSRLNEMSYFEMERRYVERTGDSAQPNNRAALETHFTRVLAAWKAGEIDGTAESFSAFEQRIVTALADYATPGKRVLVVSSGGPVGIILRHILGLDLAAMTEIILGTHNASVSRFRVLEQGLRLQQYNAVPHLDHPGRSHALTYL